MKKTFLSLALAVGALFFANAQTVESTGFFDNTSITLKGGVSALAHPRCNGYQDWAHTIQASTTLELGKWITPKFGVGIESTIGWENGSQPGFFQGRNWLNYVDVLANAKFNLNNIFHGFKGRPDKVEVVPTVGIGWVHGFTYAWDLAEDGYYYPVDGTTAHSNDIMTKYTMNVNINLNERVQFNISPYAAFNLTGGYQGTNNPRFDSRNLWYGLELGFTVKLGKQFELCPYTYTQDDIDALNAQINELRARGPEVVEKVVTKEVTKMYNPAKTVIVNFAKASAELTEPTKEILSTIDKGCKVKIEAGASPEGTEEFNMKLSEERAEAVKAYLQANGVEVTGTNAVGEELGSRIAIVVIE